MNQEEVLIPGLCAIKQLKKTNEYLVFRPNSTIIATECLKYLSHNRKKTNTEMTRTAIRQSISQALRLLPMQLDTRLYGSEARGEARPDSDIDLLILVDKPAITDSDEDKIFAPLYQIELQTGIMINPIIMPKQEWGRHISPFYINVENEGIKL